MERTYREKYVQLGLKIAYYRKLRGLMQEELAEKANISTVFLSHVEAPNVDKTVSMGTLFAIAEALNAPEYKFLMFEEDI